MVGRKKNSSRNLLSNETLTVAVDTLGLCEPSAGPALLPVVGETLIQADQLPDVTTGLVARHRLHQVRAVSGPSCWLVGDPSSSQFETCGAATECKDKDRQTFSYITFTEVFTALYYAAETYCSTFTASHTEDFNTTLRKIWPPTHVPLCPKRGGLHEREPATSVDIKVSF